MTFIMSKKKSNRPQNRANKPAKRKPQKQAAPQPELPIELQMLAPLIDYAEQICDSPEEMESLLNLLVEESIELIHEPEFEEVVISPTDTLNALAAFETAYPTPNDTEAEMSLGELQIFNEIFSETITPEVQDRILISLETMQIRGVNSPLEAQARTLISFLKTTDDPEIWVCIGLLRALIEQSIEVSYAIMEKLHPEINHP